MSVPTGKLRAAPRPVVLVTSGAYSPVHRNHLLYMEAARAFLEAPIPAAVRGPAASGPGAPVEVVGGYVSPLPDRMVARRRGGAIPRPHRVAMLQLATSASPWLMVVDADLHGTALFRAAAVAAVEALGRPVTVVAVCGADGYRASDRFLPTRIPLACVRRTGEDAEWKRLWKQTASARRVYLVEDNHQPQRRSATQIRAWLHRAEHDEQARAQLRLHLHPDVLRYLLDHPETYAS